METVSCFFLNTLINTKATMKGSKLFSLSILHHYLNCVCSWNGDRTKMQNVVLLLV